MFWGLLSQEHVLKGRCQVWGSNPLLLKEKVRVVNSLLFVGCHTKSVVYGDIVSLSLLHILVVVGWLSPPPPKDIRVAQLVFGFLSQGIFLYVAIDSM